MMMMMMTVMVMTTHPIHPTFFAESSVRLGSVRGRGGGLRARRLG
jgi:hypothetical protein